MISISIKDIEFMHIYLIIWPAQHRCAAHIAIKPKSPRSLGEDLWKKHEIKKEVYRLFHQYDFNHDGLIKWPWLTLQNWTMIQDNKAWDKAKTRRPYTIDYSCTFCFLLIKKAKKIQSIEKPYLYIFYDSARLWPWTMMIGSFSRNYQTYK